MDNKMYMLSYMGYFTTTITGGFLKMLCHCLEFRKELLGDG